MRDAVFYEEEFLMVRKEPGVPESHRQIFELLGNHGWLSADELQEAKRLVVARNAGANRYQKLNPKDLGEAAALLPCTGRFTWAVRKGQRVWGEAL